MSILMEHMIESLFSKAKFTLIRNLSCMYTCNRLRTMWCAITEGSFISYGADDIVKLPKDWEDAKIKKASYELKAVNILISALSDKVFYLILNHTSVKAMWDALSLSISFSL